MHPRRERPHWRLALAIVTGLQVFGAAPTVYGQLLEGLRYAPDITVDLNGTTVEAGVLATDDLNGGVSILALPNLPAGAQVAAAHRFPNGDLLLAFTSTVALPGAGIVEPRDIVRLPDATNTYSVEVHGQDVGIPRGAAIDALAVTAGDTILLSLDTSVGAFDDEDVIKIDGTNLALFLDLSAVGINPALDLDGLDVKENGATVLYMSFDGSGEVDGVAFDDEDVLAYNMTTQSWSLAYDGSAADAHWPAAADLTALDVILAATASATPTPIATATSTVAATATTGLTAAATSTATLTPVAATETATASATAGTSGTPTETTTLTPTPVSTATATITGLPTVTATVTGAATSTAAATNTATVTAGVPCAGDCDGSGEVTIGELITLVNIALGSRPVSACPAGDVNSDGTIAINEIIAAVGNALNGCPG